MQLVATFTECPTCKVDEALMGSIVKKEKELGKMSDDIVGCISTEIWCNVDPKRPPIAGGRIPGARAYRDMCMKCGGVYTVQIEKGYVTMPLRPELPPTFA